MTTLDLTQTESAAVRPTLRGRGVRALPWLAALLPFIALAVWRSTSGPGLEADDYAQYLMHAEALAEGRPYTDINYIYSPYARFIGPRATMPGLPVVLSVVHRIMGPNIAVMKALMLCFAVGFVVLAGLYFARHGDRQLGLGVAMLCGLSPALVHSSSQLLTDLPFTALVWGVIYVADLPGQLNWRRLLAITLLGAGAMAFRTAGLALVPALLLFTVVRYREHRLRPLIPLLAWFAGLVVLGLMLDLREASVVRLGPARLLVWLKVTNFGLLNLRGYAPALFDSHLHPFPWDRANDAFHVVTALLMVVGLAVWIRPSPGRFGVLFAIVYTGLLIVTPVRHTRFMWPLFPFFVFGLLNGVTILARRALVAPRKVSLAVQALMVILALAAVRTAAAQPRPADLLAHPDMIEVTGFMKRVADLEQPRATFFKPRSFAWATGIPTMGLIRATPDCTLAELGRRRISHLIVGGSGSRQAGTGPLRDLAQSRPDLFRLEHRNETFAIYRFQSIVAPPPSPTPDCPVP